MTTPEQDALIKALKKAFQLGQKYWQQADSESWRENKKADVTLGAFNGLLESTVADTRALSERCPACGEPDPRTGACGTSDSDTRAAELCGLERGSQGTMARQFAVDDCISRIERERDATN